MSLISDRLGYLLRTHSAAEISEITGLPLSRVSPSIGDYSDVEPRMRTNLYNLYGRQVYADLRALGASAVEARRYRRMSVEHVLARLGNRSGLLDQLVNTIFEERKQSQIKRGVYTDDVTLYSQLRESISKSMGKSKLPPSHYDYDSYPTVEHGVLEDDF